VGANGGQNRVPLRAGFFERDTATVARELLGAILVSEKGGRIAGGRIVETEAYLGADDPGSHAATRGVTKRNAVMYGPPACTYVYFTYGVHHMLNIVTQPEGTAGAVLIRALEPEIGLDVMRARRGGRVDAELTRGPGKLAAALGVELSDNGDRLGQGAVTIYSGDRVAEEDVGVSGRIGLSAGHDLDLRYYMLRHPSVSRGRIGRPRKGRKSQG
jgi:DNA-3-methyladenine glycosylase